MEAACYPEVAGCPQTTWVYNQKNHTLIGHCHEKLKSSLDGLYLIVWYWESLILAELRGCIWTRGGSWDANTRQSTCQSILVIFRCHRELGHHSACFWCLYSGAACPQWGRLLDFLLVSAACSLLSVSVSSLESHISPAEWHDSLQYETYLNVKIK